MLERPFFLEACLCHSDIICHSSSSILLLYKSSFYRTDLLSFYKNIDQHFSEIPSEKEVMENGISLGEMNALLLKKIEELTLYVIELKKENEEQKSEIRQLQNEVFKR